MRDLRIVFHVKQYPANDDEMGQNAVEQSEEK